MRRMLAVSLAIVLLAAALPAHAAGASGQIRLEDEARTHNALLAAQMIGEACLEPGETFSFNAVVGARTEERGYVPALNGRGAEVVGGGCAQAASALYLALCQLAPGTVSFDELSFYGDRYTGSYVSDGGQAVLVDYGAQRDFLFTNLSGGEMRFAMEAADGTLTCTVSIGEGSAPVAMPSFAEDAQSAPRQNTVVLYCGEDPAVLNNVALAADSIYDYTLASGDVFSFNRAVGPREEIYGYVPAVNGRGTEVVGGGVAQVASAIWLLIQDRPDVVIVEKSTYGSKYNQTYVEHSTDAILTDYNAGTDFSFRYTGDGSLTIYTLYDPENHTITCSAE